MKPLHSIIVASLVLVAFAMCVFWGETNRRGGQSPPGAAETVRTDAIGAGKPCDYTANQATDTRGLQCYLFSYDGQSAQGVWVYPPDESVPLLFDLSDDLRQDSPALKNMSSIIGAAIQGWRTYESPDGAFSFRYPATWGVTQASSDIVTAADLMDTYPGSSFSIEYHGNADFA